MSRPLRLVRLGVWYHITTRGIERCPIFRDDRDRSHFLELLGECPDRFRLRVLAFVLMENHYHLLLELREPNLSQALRWLNVSYSAWFNRRHRRSGYLFQGRFKSVIVDPAAWGYGLSAYIHLNPVRTSQFGLSKTDRRRDRAGAGRPPTPEEVRARIARLRGYQWSSYRFYAGLASAPKWLDAAEALQKGGGKKGQEKQNYRRYVENQARQGLQDSPWEELKDRVFLGGADFIDGLKKRARASLKRRETPSWLRERIAPEQIIRVVEKIKGEPWSQFKERHGDGGLALVLTLAGKRSGLTQMELSRKLGLEPSVNISTIITRHQIRLGSDPKERSLAKQAIQMLNAST